MKSSLAIRILVIGIGALGTLGAHGTERYAATVEDGTAKVIRANTAVDEDEAPARRTTVRPAAHAKAKVPATSQAAAELTQLKRQNAELKSRLLMLEQAKAEAAANERAETAAQSADEQAQTDEATGAEAGVEVGSDEASTPQVQEPVLDPAPIVTTKKLQPQKPAPKAVAPAPATKKSVTSSAANPAGFDAVPDQRIVELTHRLKYTNEILKRFGRAYDYRSTTLKDFKRILTELESAQEKTTAVN